MFSEIFLIVGAVALGMVAFERQGAGAFAPRSAVACVPAGAPSAELIIGDVAIARQDVASVRVGDEYGRAAVSIAFTPSGARIIADLTTASVGEALPISVNGRVVSAPMVHEPILGGEAQLSGFTHEEAALLAAAFAPVCP